MNIVSMILALLIFLAIVLALEGLYNLWSNKHSPEVRKIRERLERLHEESEFRPIRLERDEDNSSELALDRWLSALPSGRRLQRRVEAAGQGSTAGQVMLMSASAIIAGLLLALLLNQPATLGLAVGAAMGAVPWWRVDHLREKRLRNLERQFPEAMDLIGRSVRAGHAMPSALRMCGDEISAPLGPEFRRLADEIAYGIPLGEALQGMAARIPLSDVAYFVVVVSVQRESGGNLAEMLDSIARIMRERFKLMGDVRTLSAEGKAGAWVLCLLPFIAGGVLSLLNPKATQTLLSDPSGQRMLVWGLVAMFVGVLWIRRIVRIRV